MQNPIILFFDRHLKLTEEETAFLEEHIPIVDCQKDSVLLEEGEVSSAFYFVVDGLMRMYYLVDGIEKTTCFYERESFVSSYESFTQRKPSAHFLQTVEDSKVAVFRAETVGEILKRFPRFEVLSRMVMEAELSTYQKMIASFVTLNAEQRYLDMLQSSPDLLQRIPQYHVATYLGVSPETLSRIRRRVSAKGFIDDRQ